MKVKTEAPTRKGLAAVSVAVGLMLGVAGCSGDSGGDDKEPSASQEQSGSKGTGTSGGSGQKADDEVLAQIKGDDEIGLTITSATRDSGGFVTVSGTLTNDGSEIWSGLKWRASESEVGDANPASMAGASLVDKKGKKKYLILRDTEGKCLCTAFQGGVSAGKTKSWYAQFPAPPEGNDEVDFQIGDLPTASIKISEG